MVRAIILGGAGAIGQAVADRLLAMGWAVDITGRRTDGLREDSREPALDTSFRTGTSRRISPP
jgi:NAD(P)-dependent dehydrogenase (short-subunit alcohol dehydrogenase family)